MTTTAEQHEQPCTHDELADVLTTLGPSRTVQALSNLLNERRVDLRRDGEHDASTAMFEAACVLDYQATRLQEASL